ncbi:MAG: DNA-directed RNA polymerase subunit omega [Saprospiraceae bacterium]
MDIKTKVLGKKANIIPRNIYDFLAKEGVDNIYEALAIINKRAIYITSEVKEELRKKLEDFTMSYEAIEEVVENREQIEITKFYEKCLILPLLLLRIFE